MARGNRDLKRYPVTSKQNIKKCSRLRMRNLVEKRWNKNENEKLTVNDPVETLRGRICCEYISCRRSKQVYPHLRMYRFPNNSEDRLKQWVTNCGNPRLLKMPIEKLRTKCICELHFNPECFINATKHRLTFSAVPNPHQQFANATQTGIKEGVVKEEVEDSTTVYEEDFTVKPSKKKYRNRTCFVPDCTSGYRSNKDQVSLFSAPTNENLKQQWQVILPRKDRELQNEDVVCEKHFHEESIIRSMDLGNSVYTYQRPKLKKDAVPTMVDKNPNNLSEHSTEILFVETPKIEYEYIDIKEEDIKDEINDPSAMLLFNNMKQIKRENTELFQSISEDKLAPIGWNVNRLEIEDGVLTVFNQVKVFNTSPFVYKSLVVKEDLSGSIFYLQRKFQDLSISSISDVKDKLRQMEEQNICEGGPKTNETFGEYWTSGVATVDDNYGRWRHIDCKIVCEIDLKCVNCANITFIKNEVLDETYELNNIS